MPPPFWKENKVIPVSFVGSIVESRRLKSQMTLRILQFIFEFSSF